MNLQIFYSKLIVSYYLEVVSKSRYEISQYDYKMGNQKYFLQLTSKSKSLLMEYMIRKDTKY